MKSEIEYATCESCNRKMHGTSCKGFLIINGTKVSRLAYGDNGEQADGLCHDCGCKGGQLHHWGCDNEVCPKCHGQALGCECGEDYQLEVTTTKTEVDWKAVAKGIKKKGLLEQVLNEKWKPTWVKSKKDKTAYFKALEAVC